MEGQKKIEKYQFNLKKVLGQGSYATVYLGRELETEQEVAVKVIDKKIFSNAYNVKNIQSEIDIMKKVSHENIVKLFDIYQTSNNMYIVTELCPHGDLYHLLLKKKRLPESQAKAFLEDIMNGAKYLHKNGIIHRDLKPANILLKEGTCKLSDFGFAKSINNDQIVMKSIVGTPLYMSPQILKKAKYTVKSDLWSIGLIYYEMLHGRTPWPANTEIELINAIYSKPIHFSTEISERSKSFILGCLKIDEDERFSWEESFNHKLFQDFSQKQLNLNLDPTKRLQVEDKENVNASNKMKTPTHKHHFKEEKSPSNFFKKKKDNLSTLFREKNESCLTPKAKVTPKKNEKTKSELKVRNEGESKTIKKEMLVIKSDKFKLY